MYMNKDKKEYKYRGEAENFMYKLQDLYGTQYGSRAREKMGQELGVSKVAMYERFKRQNLKLSEAILLANKKGYEIVLKELE